MLHASRMGIDSHGVRLTAHYCRMLGGGRLNKNPQLSVEKRGSGSAMVHGDDGLGHHAAYKAVEVGIELAGEAGVGAVGVQHSSHLGAAGAYALAAAEQGFVAFATTNTDSVVALFDGAQKIHGTNPLAFAAPVPGQRPWLLDMATSSIPLNRVMLHRSLDKALPEGVAATPEGEPTTDPYAAEMLLPLGVMERAICLLKMRGSKHDLTLRRYVVTPEGMAVGEAWRDANGILSGNPTFRNE